MKRLTNERRETLFENQKAESTLREMMYQMRVIQYKLNDVINQETTNHYYAFLQKIIQQNVNIKKINSRLHL